MSNVYKSSSMRAILFLVPIFLLSVACVPSRTLIDVNEENNIASFNNLMKGKGLILRFVEGENINPEKLVFTADSLTYWSKKKEHTIPLSDVKSITTSPKPNLANIISIPLIVIGILGLASFDSSGAIGPELGKAYLGTMSLVTGTVVYVVGNTMGSKTYYFNQSD